MLRKRHWQALPQSRCALRARSASLTVMAVAACVAALAFSAPSAAQPVTERSKQKQAAERQRGELQQKLDLLKRDIDRTEAAKGSAADALAESESAISKANRSLRDLSDEQKQAEGKLAQLVRQQGELSRVVDAQQAQLSKLMRQQYVAGNEDRIKLLLSGDNPNRINRELQYMGYVSQAQAKLIETLRINLQAVRDNKAKTQNTKFELEEIAGEQREQKTVLEQEKAKRTALLAQLSLKLSSQRKEAGTIQRNEQQLSTLVDKLAALIEEQKKAEAAAREKAREAREKRQQERLARAQAKAAERERAAALAKAHSAPSPSASAAPSPSSAPSAADAIDDDEPPSQAAESNDAIPMADDDFGQPFVALRGKLRLPVRGDLVGKFGARRGDGGAWKGWFIRAAEGSEVKAVAAGRVVYADWLRGFGNLIIIDHGKRYMTIYGNNQAVLKRPGDLVKAGEVIAAAGNSGGNEQSGLYFEMRHEGRAFDPLGWVTTR
ncbi:MAG: protease [Herbaspirillum sp.]|jgi:septal ring factor EnvC (AmiA/AmiB activator)|nr:protease [Herbaspirillum sp.]